MHRSLTQSATNTPGIIVAVLPYLMGAWLLTTACVAGLQAWLAPEWLTPSLLIAAASGSISLAALLPGAFLQRSSGPNVSPSQLLMQAAMGAMAIRIVGTVALTALCQYHMGESMRPMAFLILGYYVVLTSAEVALIARRSMGHPPHKLWTEKV